MDFILDEANGTAENSRANEQTEGRIQHKNAIDTMKTATLRRLFLHPLFLALVGFSVAYRDILQKLFQEWSRDEYSHGFLVPFLALLMAAHRVSEIKPDRGSAIQGLLWTGVSLVLLFFSELSTFRQVGFFAIVILAVGISLFFAGKEATKKAAPAFILLLFAIPLPFMIYNNLSLHLKTVSSVVGVNVLDLIGYSVYREGNVIDLGTYKLQVADACSGLRYLFPAACLSYLIAYLYNGKAWKRWFVFLSAIPITIGMNALRIAVIGITVNIFGIEAAEGFIHAFEGYAMFMLCVALLIAEVFGLLALSKNDSFDLSLFSIPSARHIHEHPGRRMSFLLLVMAFLAAGVSFFGTSFASLSPSPGKAPAPQLASFPLSIGNWTGTQREMDPAALKDLTLSDYMLADYSRQDGTPPVNLYIAYYAKQEIGSAIHSPATCLPGNGWSIDDSKIINLEKLRGGSKPLQVARLMVSRGNSQQLIYYWFDERGRNITSQFSAKWYLMIDMLISSRSDGALVRVITPIGQSESEDTADARLQEFLQKIYPLVEQRFSSGSTKQRANRNRVPF